MYTQVRDFVISNGGSKPLYCLQNVRKGYGIPPLYPNAITAWHNTEQHKNRNFPAGVDVPVYFSWKVDGHIGVQLADGRFWSDGKIYASLKKYEAVSAPVFLGWGESVNKYRVIERSKKAMITNRGLYIVARFYLGRAATQAEIDKYVGKVDFDTVASHFSGSDAYKQQVAKYSGSSKIVKNELAGHLPGRMR